MELPDGTIDHFEQALRDANSYPGCLGNEQERLSFALILTQLNRIERYCNANLKDLGYPTGITELADVDEFFALPTTGRAKGNLEKARREFHVLVQVEACRRHLRSYDAPRAAYAAMQAAVGGGFLEQSIVGAKVRAGGRKGGRIRKREEQHLIWWNLAEELWALQPKLSERKISRIIAERQGEKPETVRRALRRLRMRGD